MRRPLAFFSAAFMAGIVFADIFMTEFGNGLSSLQRGGGFLFGVLLILLFLGRWGVYVGDRESAKGKKALLMMATGFIAGAMLLGIHGHVLSEEPLLQQEGEHATLTGVVIYESFYERTGYDGKPQKMWQGILVLEEEKGPGKLLPRRVMVRGLPAESAKETLLGLTVRVTGTVQLPARRRNPGGFDYAKYLKGKEVAVTVTGEKITPLGVKSHRHRLTGRIMVSLKQRSSAYLSEASQALFFAMVFGDKSMLTEERYERYQENGTAHVLATSGLHVGLLYAGITRLLGKKRRGWHNPVLLFALLFYGQLAQGAVGVERALLMILLHIGANRFHLPYDMLSALSLAAVLQLSRHPYLLFSTGFQLSFLASFLLALILPWYERVFSEGFVKRSWQKGERRKALWLGRLMDLFLPIILLQAFLIPYQIYVFHYVSFSAFFANIPLAYLASVAVPLGLVSILPLCTALQMTCLDKILSAIEIWNTVSYQDGLMSWRMPAPPFWTLPFFYGLLIWRLSEGGRIHRLRYGSVSRFNYIAKPVAMVLAASFLLAMPYDDGYQRCHAVFVDVGQGSALHLRAGKGKHILIDGGGKATYDVGKKTVMPYLLAGGVGKVDLAMVTHLDTDHYDGIKTLCREGMVKKLAVAKVHEKDLDVIMEETGMAEEDILFLSPGDLLQMGRYEIFVLGPLQASEEENANSLVLHIQTNKGDLLVTGDIDAEVESALLDAYGTEIPRPNVMWVPHHGSRYSSSEAFVAATAPDIAVIQVGKNNFGHPAEEVISRYENAGTRVYRNDLAGAVGITWKERFINVRTML